jgi:hypothetical protein
VLLLAGPRKNGRWWDGVGLDTASSIPDVYDVWRAGEDNDVVFVEVRLDEHDNPLGFPDHILDRNLLGSMTIWPMPHMPSFIWWSDPVT